MEIRESDVCILGAGITSAMVAERLSERRPDWKITVVEAGRRTFDLDRRFALRKRSQQYGENPWPDDFIADQVADGQISHTMAVGGQALHWGGTCNRFSAEDLELKSRYGLYVDWPLAWAELERYYCQAEHRLGVSGEASRFPQDAASQPYPMPPMELSWNLLQYQAWARQAGLEFQGVPQAKNTVPYGGRAQCRRCGTCDICPTGAKYSPDFTFQQLLAANKITLDDHTLVRRLVADPASGAIVAARGNRRLPVNSNASHAEVEYRARVFVLASGYTWSPHLLLLSGVANRHGQVGKYMNGHEFTTAMIEFDGAIYPGMNPDYGLICREFFRCEPAGPYVRHDLRIFESASRGGPRLKGDNGQWLFGDEVAADWRKRGRATARVRAYCDVHPAENSELTLDATRTNEWGDPLPKIVHRFDAATVARDAATQAHLAAVFARLAHAHGGHIATTSRGDYLDHPAGGCRMGTDPATSVCDSYGRTHESENLYVVGAPTMPTAGCTNGTLTFVALALRSADAIAG